MRNADFSMAVYDLLKETAGVYIIISQDDNVDKIFKRRSMVFLSRYKKL